MPEKFDLVGQRFGRLVVQSKHPERHRGYHVQWVCLCDPEHEGCGKIATVTTGNLNRGTQSCGCFIRESIRKAKVTHGLTKTAEYGVWRAIVQRCCNPNHKRYQDYGGRGITMCEKWRNNFMEFLADMGPRPTPWHSIDRRENDKGYEPGNCRWATKQEQENNKRNNLYVEFDGETKTLAEWCRELHLDYDKTQRLVGRRGLSLEDAIERMAADASAS